MNFSQQQQPVANLGGKRIVCTYVDQLEERLPTWTVDVLFAPPFRSVPAPPLANLGGFNTVCT
jgi:hypothetical protein